jgi:hypothetical protein
VEAKKEEDFSLRRSCNPPIHTLKERKKKASKKVLSKDK